MRLLLCATHADVPRLDPLIAALRGTVVVTTTALLAQPPTVADPRPALQAAIQDADAVVFVVSAAWLKDRHCRWAYKEAIANTRPVVLALLEALPSVPRALDGQVAADFTQPSAGRDLQEALAALGAPPPAARWRAAVRAALLVLVIVAGVGAATWLAGPFSPWRAQALAVLDTLLAANIRAAADPQAPPEGLSDGEQRQARTDQALAAAARAGLLFGEGRTSEALAEVNAALAALPADAAPSQRAALHLLRGDLARAQGRDAAALDDYNAAIARDDTLAQAYMQRASLLLALGDAGSAVRDATRALDLVPGLAEALNLRGAAHFRLGDVAATVQDTTAALALLPAYADALANRGLALRYLGQRKSARADFDAAIALDPRLAKAYTGRGLVALDEGRFEVALEDFDTALALAPDDIEARYPRALILAALGRTADAVNDLSRAIDARPTDANLYLRRGSARRCLGEANAAVADFSAAITQDLDAAYAWLSAPEAFTCPDPAGDATPPPPLDAVQLAVNDPALTTVALLLSQAFGERAAADDDDAARLVALDRAIALQPVMAARADLLVIRAELYAAAADWPRAYADYALALDTLRTDDVRAACNAAAAQVAWPQGERPWRICGVWQPRR